MARNNKALLDPPFLARRPQFEDPKFFLEAFFNYLPGFRKWLLSTAEDVDALLKHRDLIDPDGDGSVALADLATLATAATTAANALLLAGQTSAFHLARANHTGTQVKATVSDLETITTTPTASAVPKADGSNKIADGWLSDDAIGSLYRTITQTAHGYVAQDVLYFQNVANKWQKAQANAAGTMGMIVVLSATTDTFVACPVGFATIGSHGLTIGSQYYLSAATAGALTTTPPASPNFVQPILKPVTTSAVVLNCGGWYPGV